MKSTAIIKAGVLIFLEEATVLAIVFSSLGNWSVRMEDTPAKTWGEALGALRLLHNWRIVGITHSGISGVVRRRFGVFFLVVVGLRGVLLIGVLGFA